MFNPDLATNGWQSPHTVVQIVTDDMPFLVDSVRMVMTSMHLGIHLVLHPMLSVERDGDRYVECGDGMANEAWMYLEVDRCDPARREALHQRLVESLDDVHVAVTDWRAIRDRSEQLAHDLEHNVLPLGSMGGTAPRRSCGGWVTTTSSSSATASTTSSRTRTARSSSRRAGVGSGSAAQAGGGGAPVAGDARGGGG